MTLATSGAMLAERMDELANSRGARGRYSEVHAELLRGLLAKRRVA